MYRRYGPARHPLRNLFALICLLALLQSGVVHSQSADQLTPELRKYLRVSSAHVVLEHAQVLDGTGGPPNRDQNITIDNGKITAIAPGADVLPSPDVAVLDLRGYSVLPGLVGMHGHLWFYARPNLQVDGSYDHPSVATEMSFSAPRLYLANGITTMRTAGSIEPQTDVNLKQAIERGIALGPHLDVTGPYLDGPSAPSLRPQVLKGPEDARETVAFWADHGVTSFKVYADATRAELRAVVAEAHKRKLKVLGHLCSITYVEAAEIGIDSLEHGFFANTQLDPDKKPDKCSESSGDYTLAHMSDQQAQQLIATLIKYHVALTSTLANTASYAPSLNPSVNGQPQLQPAVSMAMSPAVRDSFFIDFKRSQSNGPDLTKLLRRDMELERAFVAAGGLLMAGSDPVGLRGLVPGFADHREIELLVESGFTPAEAVRIASLNGAIFLGRQDHIGTVSAGKNADLVVVKGDPAAHIADIENVEIVFKDGVGYDTQKLLESVKGHYGEF